MNNERNRGVSLFYILIVVPVLFFLMIVLSNPPPANAQTSVRITPNHLERLYNETVRIYRQTDSDSATIIFSRGTLQRVRDLKKLNAANVEAFVELVRDHIEERVNALIYQLQQRPLSSGDSPAEALPGIVEEVSRQISAMASAKGATPEDWQSLGESLRELQLLIEEQRESNDTNIFFDWEWE